MQSSMTGSAERLQRENERQAAAMMKLQAEVYRLRRLLTAHGIQVCPSSHFLHSKHLELLHELDVVSPIVVQQSMTSVHGTPTALHGAPQPFHLHG